MPSPGDLPDPGISLTSLISPALAAGSRALTPLGSPVLPFSPPMLIAPLLRLSHHLAPAKALGAPCQATVHLDWWLIEQTSELSPQNGNTPKSFAAPSGQPCVSQSLRAPI